MERVVSWFHSPTAYSVLLKWHNSDFQLADTELSSLVLYIDLEPQLLKKLRQKLKRIVYTANKKCWMLSRKFLLAPS